jgi:hypothetical protein
MNISNNAYNVMNHVNYVKVKLTNVSYAQMITNIIFRINAIKYALTINTVIMLYLNAYHVIQHVLIAMENQIIAQVVMTIII